VALLAKLPPPEAAPTILVINKVDLLRAKSAMLPLMAELNRAFSFAAAVPTSMTGLDGVDRVLGEIAARLPEAPPVYDADTLTDRPISYFIREYVREQVLLNAQREVPHAVAVSIDTIEERPSALIVRATIHVEKPGQRRIVVGKGGERIRDIGIAARQRISELVGKKVHLELFVRVTPRWKDAARLLAELGYDTNEKPQP
jgi:GTP-binding protein Era